MKIIEISQGTDTWHTHRAQHFNASEAAAMLNVSPHKTRDQLLREKATGLVPEVDEATQRRFDEGHRIEALARPFAEEIIGTDLYPCVGVLDGTKLSASFDGLTMDESTVWECKTMNAVLCECSNMGVGAHELPEHYRAQMEQQLLVSGAEQVLFSAVAFDADGTLREESRWEYESDPILRQRILDGWAQFERDLAAWQPEPLPVPKPAGRVPDTLPALTVQVTGQVVASNIAEFKQQAFAVLDSINRNLQTDEDFADAESTIKWCKQAEAKIAATKDHVQGQMVDVDAVLRTLDEVSSHTRNIRLELDKLVRIEKENRKLELLQAAEKAIAAHRHELNQRLAAHSEELGFAPTVTAGYAVPGVSGNILHGVTKGLRSLESMQSALNATVADQKIAADAEYRRIEANIDAALAVFDQFHLLPDLQRLIETKETDDLKAIIAARVAAHEQKERERQEAERARIRAEEAARLEREQQERQIREDRHRIDSVNSLALAENNLQAMIDHARANHPEDVLEMVKADDSVLVRLGEINAAIAPLSITADGLASLGFAHITTDPAAKFHRLVKLYRAADFPRMRQAIIQHLAGAQLVLETDTRAAA